MKKFLVMAIVALSMVFTSCGISGGGLDNAPKCDDQAGTINGVAYDKETIKCWKVDTRETTVYSASPEDNKDVSETFYEWDTEYATRKKYELLKAAGNVSFNLGWGISGSSTYEYTMTEVQGRDEDTCYESYGQ